MRSRNRTMLTLLAALLAGCPSSEPIPGSPPPPSQPEPPASWDDVTVAPAAHHEGFGHPFALAAADLDGDGDDEILYGGRGLAIVDADTRAGGPPRFAPGWPQRGSLAFDGDNTWVVDVVPAHLDDDGVIDAFVVDVDQRLYAWDGATGTWAWHVELDDVLVVMGLTVADFDGDGVPDVFVAGADAARSGVDGSVLWRVDMTLPPAFALAAELDGLPGQDLLLVSELDDFVVLGEGFAPMEPTVMAVSGDGTVLWEARTTSSPVRAVAADLDGDGGDEAVVALQESVIAVGRDGWSWSLPLEGVAWRMAAIDADGDGDDEVALAEDRQPGGVVRLVDGDGSVIAARDGEPFHDQMSAAAIAGSASQQLLVATSGLDGAGTLVALELVDGALEERWRADLGLAAESMTLATEGAAGHLVVVGDATTSLVALSLRDGAEVWRWSGVDFGMDGLAVDLDGDGIDEIVQIDVSSRVLAVDAIDGSRRWATAPSRAATGFALDAGDLDGDGRVDLVGAGVRRDDGAGIVTRYDRDGAERWSVALQGMATDVAVGNLDATAELEVVVGYSSLASCGVIALDHRGEELWRSERRGCLRSHIDVADVDGDGVAEVAYGEQREVGPWEVALVGGSGRDRWATLVEDRDSVWVKVLPGLVVHGGYHVDPEGHVTALDADDGAVRWEHRPAAGVDPDFGGPLPSGSLQVAQLPDIDEDGVDDLIVSTAEGTSYALSRASGAVAWSLRTEAEDTPWSERHLGAAFGYVAATAEFPHYLVVADGSVGRQRSSIHAVTLDGEIVESIPRDGWGVAVAVGSEGPAVIGGLDVITLEVVDR